MTCDPWWGVNITWFGIYDVLKIGRKRGGKEMRTKKPRPELKAEVNLAIEIEKSALQFEAVGKAHSQQAVSSEETNDNSQEN